MITLDSLARAVDQFYFDEARESRRPLKRSDLALYLNYVCFRAIAAEVQKTGRYLGDFNTEVPSFRGVSLFIVTGGADHPAFRLVNTRAL